MPRALCHYVLFINITPPHAPGAYNYMNYQTRQRIWSGNCEPNPHGSPQGPAPENRPQTTLLIQKQKDTENDTVSTDLQIIVHRRGTCCVQVQPPEQKLKPFLCVFVRFGILCVSLL
ncbi:hypothetical protein AVEN_275253-1 [Araneus ventricosus]|uniref:Uncharacterized protein n=1 Tax=Araneus ventricosus TaxID=182803 RepID=A0A4Y2M402_ARAVE|nr:hypothetical protein AVEN_275253-1 [Araneus ventricosus]